MNKKNIGKKTVKTLATVAMAAAVTECGKLALAFIPNVEVVTLLCALFGYVFGIYGILSSAIFVCIEPLIYGFGPWVISYFIYWPLVSLVFCLFGKSKIRNRWICALAAVLLTLFFGVLTSLVDVGLFQGRFDRFFYRFGIYYARGVVFYAIQTVSNAVIFTSLFPYLSKKLTYLKDKTF